MKIPAPRTIRQTFDLFQLYRDELGIASLVNRLDWTGVTPHQVYAANLGRLPEGRATAVAKSGYHAAAHFAAGLESAEFQSNFIKNYLNAYYEKKRLLFVHIPKCAGTDFEVDLADRFSGLPQSIMIPEMTTKRDLFAAAARLAGEASVSQEVLVYGHLTLKWYLDNRLYRFGDRIFGIVREPTALILSLVNYIVMVLYDDPEVTRLDTAEWLAALGLNRLPLPLHREEAAELGRHVLRNRRLVQPNYLCTYLGSGTATSTIDLLAASDIELAQIGNYEMWRSAAWNLPASRKQNHSRPCLAVSDLTKPDHDYIMDITAEDRRFYGWFLAVAAHSEGLSLRGLEVARAAMER